MAWLRRRWLAITLFVVTAVVVGFVAWTLRPLNATERRLVGTWRMQTSMWSMPPSRVTLAADRRYLVHETPGQPPVCVGTWSGAEKRFVLRPHRPLSWQGLRGLLYEFLHPELVRHNAELKILSADNFWTQTWKENDASRVTYERVVER